ncbi:N-acetylmuramoyl-L-alanine amidase [Carnimonas sp. R-84981]|uniref:N-acetylmuramoyl-L-alanine amidase n=1 Tax=Carnimonas bestiolae TaxID=3402172 RepID=UPI003EDB99DA
MMTPSLQTKSLLISAGHSDTDPGAIANGYHEADIVLEFRDLLADYLSSRVVAATDGEKGQNLPLTQAIALAQQHDVALEFHCNAATATATGCETLSRPQDFDFGNLLCATIASTLGIANRGAKGSGAGQHSRLGFVDDGHGIIVELFFITNAQDLAAYFAHKEALVTALGDLLIDIVTAPEYCAS